MGFNSVRFYINYGLFEDDKNRINIRNPVLNGSIKT